MSKDKFNFVIAEDHPLYRTGTKQFLEEQFICKVFEAENGNEALEIISNNQIDLLITDIEMPLMDGRELLKNIKNKYTNVKIIALTNYTTIEYLKPMMSMGADCILFKTTKNDELKKAIETILIGKPYTSPDFYKIISSNINIEDNTQTLTNREIQVLTEIAKGKKNKQIANELFIAYNTVKTHRQNLLSKLNAKNTAQLILIAKDLGYLD